MLRKAILNDIPEIMEIIKNTIVEMHSYQNYQWDETYPLASDFEKDIEDGTLYVREYEGKLVAFICVNRVEPDAYAELHWYSSQPGVVIHRMSVHPDYRRRGLALELMNFAETLACSQDLPYLKTDTNSLNEKMQALFLRCGYRFIGEINFLGKETPFYCYDKVIR